MFFPVSPMNRRGKASHIMRFSKWSPLFVCLGMASIATAQTCPPDPTQCSADWVSGCSPIVINFENGSYRLTGTNDPVVFDISGTGHPVRIGWTKRGADEAFLALDRDHDGKITSGVELFGTVTPLGDGSIAGNGFNALAQSDENHDGVIDEHDAIWSQLLLWRDWNHDAISQPSELTPVAASSWRGIALEYHWTGRRDSWGNSFGYESRVWIANGNRITPRPVYDIFFAPVTLLAQNSQPEKQRADTAVAFREAVRDLADESPDVARQYEHLASEPPETRSRRFAELPSAVKSALWTHHLRVALTTHPEFTAEQQAVIDDGIRLLSPELYETHSAAALEAVHELTLRAQRLFPGNVALRLFVEIGSVIPVAVAPRENAHRTIAPTAMDCGCSVSDDWCSKVHLFDPNWSCHLADCNLKDGWSLRRVYL
jgi:hypothetical protein